jgi:antitoxin (DNA-binding transcriptional repressor) of toxin-antitoxin stability system
MKAIGVKVLKAKLSEYLRLVKAGETVLVTERDEVIAELRPANRQRIPPSSLEEELERMAERGEVTLRACEPGGEWRLPPSADLPKIPGLDLDRVMDELRADRWEDWLGQSPQPESLKKGKK